ncbi:YceD family protein [Archangium violaceum]|uniref:Ribosomal protein L32p n=1 Tax=Archangium violaceum Cb vi76 TaxID=1406225 RepID=A0A084SI15_9BACT|nr:DUF177 domain-containing protein [Archangium violaceum]KFA88100.1 ribosomal protein L32p [Archangium violaceum Cb vi76]
MLVKIEEIRDTGLQVKKEMSLESLEAALEGSSFRPLEPLAVSASLRKVSGGVLLEGRFTSRVVAECKRCLTESKLELPVSFTLNLVPESLARGEGLVDEDEEDEEKKDKGTGESGGSFALDDADAEVFDGKVIDLEPIVREQVLLALPMNTVCREECKGLCMKCGQNLNDKACGCDMTFVDPRLAALKNIKLKG